MLSSQVIVGQLSRATAVAGELSELRGIVYVWPIATIAYVMHVLASIETACLLLVLISCVAS
jgi:hypothetical protein